MLSLKSVKTNRLHCGQCVTILDLYALTDSCGLTVSFGG
nr:hypothetical protein KCFLNJMA_KCFLNJMA_CDS_0007 [Microvirus sp.]